MTPAPMPPHELVLGGQKSGKSRHAEARAAAWLATAPAHRCVFVATAEAHDDEMRERIARHRADRAARLPAATTVEAPRALPEAIARHSAPGTLVVVDCLTLWLAALLMPATENSEPNRPQAQDWRRPAALISIAIEQAPGPLVLVSNEIGLGVVPLGAGVRRYVDALGLVNQRAAACCPRVTLMAAALPLALKGGAA